MMEQSLPLKKESFSFSSSEVWLLLLLLVPLVKRSPPLLLFWLFLVCSDEYSWGWEGILLEVYWCSLWRESLKVSLPYILFF